MIHGEDSVEFSLPNQALTPSSLLRDLGRRNNSTFG
jgi:hypothetical protein